MGIIDEELNEKGYSLLDSLIKLSILQAFVSDGCKVMGSCKSQISNPQTNVSSELVLMDGGSIFLVAKILIVTTAKVCLAVWRCRYIVPGLGDAGDRSYGT